MADKYPSFEVLAENEKRGIDYDIFARFSGLRTTIVCPHAGGIEVGTSELARNTALTDFNIYLFEGLKPTDNKDLHITSAKFDEPTALEIMSKSEFALSYHGFKSDEKYTIVGGSNEELNKNLVKRLQNGGFNAVLATDRFAGADPNNIVNRTTTGIGVQLELSTTQRKAFFLNNDWSKNNRMNFTNEFRLYVAIVRDFLKYNENQNVA